MVDIRIAKKEDLEEIKDDLSAVSSAVSQKADAGHNHDGIYQPTGDYAASNHTHTYSEINGLPNIPPDVSDEVAALRTELDVLKGVVEGLQRPDDPVE